MKFLICYSDEFDAHRSKVDLPLSGSIVDVDGLDGLMVLQKKLGHSLIVHDSRYVAVWADYLNTTEPEENTERHRVSKLPDGWREMRWLEVYNGYRE